MYHDPKDLPPWLLIAAETLFLRLSVRGFQEAEELKPQGLFVGQLVDAVHCGAGGWRPGVVRRNIGDRIGVEVSCHLRSLGSGTKKLAVLIP